MAWCRSTITLGKLFILPVSLSPSSIIWYRPKGGDSTAGKVTTDLVKVMPAYCRVYDCWLRADCQCSYRGRPNFSFGFGTETWSKPSFGVFSISLGCAKLNDRNWPCANCFVCILSSIPTTAVSRHQVISSNCVHVRLFQSSVLYSWNGTVKFDLDFFWKSWR